MAFTVGVDVLTDRYGVPSSRVVGVSPLLGRKLAAFSETSTGLARLSRANSIDSLLPQLDSVSGWKSSASSICGGSIACSSPSRTGDRTGCGGKSASLHADPFSLSVGDLRRIAHAGGSSETSDASGSTKGRPKFRDANGPLSLSVPPSWIARSPRRSLPRNHPDLSESIERKRFGRKKPRPEEVLPASVLYEIDDPRDLAGTGASASKNCDLGDQTSLRHCRSTVIDIPPSPLLQTDVNLATAESDVVSPAVPCSPGVSKQNFASSRRQGRKQKRRSSKDRNPFEQFEDKGLRLQLERKWLQDEEYLEERTRNLRLEATQTLLNVRLDVEGGNKFMQNSIFFSRYALDVQARAKAAAEARAAAGEWPEDGAAVDLTTLSQADRGRAPPSLPAISRSQTDPGKISRSHIEAEALPKPVKRGEKESVNATVSSIRDMQEKLTESMDRDKRPRMIRGNTLVGAEMQKAFKELGDIFRRDAPSTEAVAAPSLFGRSHGSLAASHAGPLGRKSCLMPPALPPGRSRTKRSTLGV